MISYKEFTRLVPQETSEFIDFISPILEYYTNSSRYLEFRKTEETSKHYFSKMLFLLVYGMCFQKEYESLFSKYGFDKNRLKIPEKFVSDSKKLFYQKEQAFLQIGNIIPDLQDETFYGTLFPINILLPVLDSYCRDCKLDVFNELFPSCENIDTFKREIMEYNLEKTLKYESDLEQKLYGNLPISVISYLETASKIRSVLYKKISKDSIDLKKIDEDIVPMSFFLALYHYTDLPIYKEENISEQSAIKAIFQSKGITFEKVCQQLGVGIGVQEIKSASRNLVAIRDLYIRYAKEGFFSEKEDKDVSVRGMVMNLFNRSFTNSVAIDKLFSKLNFYIGTFSNFEETVINEIAVQKRNYSLSYVKNFYNDLSKEVREFIEFSAKTYLLVLKKMKEKKHNSKLLFGEDDADTLALFIATYYYECDVSEFFKDYGITLNNVLALLNLKLTKEEIESIELDQKILVDRYKRFVREGVNSNMNAKNIKINSIANNLCNRDFNRSMIMESIFSELANTRQITLQSEFLNQLQAHITEKENRRKIKLTQSLFRDLPVESMEYLETASRIHNSISDKIKNCQEGDIKTLSLLLAVFSSSSKETKEFFEFYGFSQQSICNYLGISSNNLLKGSIDIDLLAEEYGSYIFGGKNKQRERKDLTILNISHNIFFRDINNSVFISKFLAHFNHSYGDFERFDECYQAYADFTKEKRRKEEAEKTIKDYNYCGDYLRNVFRIHQRIYCQLGDNRSSIQFLSSREDIKEASMILGLFTVNNNSVFFFRKNGITEEEILRKSGLFLDTLKNLYNDDIDYLSATKLYAPYLEKDTPSYKSRRSVDDFAKRIFDTTINDSMFLENISSYMNVNYDILKEEVESGMDYELSLSIDDRIQLLSTEKVDTLDISQVKSVLHFGNSLSIHSKYIYDQYPKLSLSDTHKESIKNINSIIERVYEREVPQEQPKRGFFAKLFSKPVKEDEERVIFNQQAIEELKKEISRNIELLSEELLHYDELRRYMEVYRRKNRSYYLIVSDMITKLESELQILDPKNDEHYHSFLTDSSRIQVMRDKANRFSETNQLTKQELFKVNQAIVNHFITINALEMAKDHLLPLVESEIAIGKGRETENQSLMLSQGVINLFQSLLSRNVEKAVQNMEQIKKCNISSDVFEMLNRDISVYFNGITQSQDIQSRIEILDIDQAGIEEPKAITVSNDDGSINLTLTGIKPKEKVLVSNHPSSEN